MAWFYLLLAILLEVAAAVAMKLSYGFDSILASILIFIFYGLCLVAFTLALREIELGIAYAVSSGLGTALVAIVGIFEFSESTSIAKIICILLIIIGIIGLRYYDYG